jgi:hypothetical protein
MGIKAVEMTRKIRDKIYQETKKMSASELENYLRKQSTQFQKECSQRQELQVRDGGR